MQLLCILGVCGNERMHTDVKLLWITVKHNAVTNGKNLQNSRLKNATVRRIYTQMLRIST